VREALTGRPGPVLLSLPEDLLDEVVELEPVDSARPAPARATPDEIRSVIELLASARRPAILAGGGVLRARTSTELIKFAELLHVPIVAAWRRGDVVSNDHPLYLGMAGLGAPASVRDRLAEADSLLVLGCRLNEATTYGYTLPAAGTRWAHVDLVPSRSGDLPPAELAVTSDARSFLRAANERLLGGTVLDAERVAARDENNATDRATWEAATVVDATPWDGPGVHPGVTIATLRRVLPDEAIVTTDAGNFGGWAGRGFRFRRPGTFLGPTSGAMGYGLPAAITAALVHRDRPVVALVGDGGLAMTMAELETAVREGVRVVVVVFDNERYGTIRMHQDQRGTGEGVGTDLGPVDFAAIARAVGARGARVEQDDAFEPALRAALAAERPTVIQLTLDRRWVSVDRPAV
jgi:acetolactate synthase-1/2/3 large subunit